MSYYQQYDTLPNSKETQLKNFTLPSCFFTLSLHKTKWLNTKIVDFGNNYVASYPIKKGPTGLYLWSSNSGTGKTSLAIAITKTLIEEGKTHWNSTFLVADDLFEQLRSIYNNSQVLKETKLFQRIIKSDITIIDDIGIEKLTKFIAQRYFYLLNALWSENRTVFFTSKFPLSMLIQRAEPDVDNEVLDSIVSRMSAMVTSIEVTGDIDYRQHE
jgi:DNA replication protein DnaC